MGAGSLGPRLKHGAKSLQDGGLAEAEWGGAALEGKVTVITIKGSMQNN